MAKKENKEKCYFCKEEKEVGKELFWCPRLRSHHNGPTYYGNWVCVECCKNEFFESIHDMHTKTSYQGICPYCDFPIGAILYANRDNEDPPEELFITKRIDKWFIDSTYNFSYLYDYYGFRWDHHQNRLTLIRKAFNEGIGTLVLRKKKLPTRIVITLEDTFTYHDYALSWNELNRYYWSSCGCEQHFKEEEWMDQAPVIICSGYLNQEGFNFDEKFKKKIENLRKKFSKKQQKEKK
ncbi:MAG: hypothetical protein ACFFDN_00465 [Candidatus Hodarchaeota archaeon]